MKIILYSEILADYLLIDAPCIPRIGDTVDKFRDNFYTAPRVINVLMFPSLPTLEKRLPKGIFSRSMGVNAIVTVE